jgi:hypothetical protein
MELPASLDRMRLLDIRALAAGRRIMALVADFAEGVCKGGHGDMARAKAAHPLVMAVTALVLHELAGGFVEGGRSWLKGPHLDERLELGRERHGKGKQRALFWCKVDLGTGDAVVEGAEMREVELSGVEVGMTKAEELAHEHEELSISTVVSDCGFTPRRRCATVLHSPTFYTRLSATCPLQNSQCDWPISDLIMTGILKWLPAGVKPQSPTTVDGS